MIKGSASNEFNFLKSKEHGLDDGFAAYEWEENEKDLDRAWYDAEEQGNQRFYQDTFDDSYVNE